MKNNLPVELADGFSRMGTGHLLSISVCILPCFHGDAAPGDAKLAAYRAGVGERRTEAVS